MTGAAARGYGQAQPILAGLQSQETQPCLVIRLVTELYPHPRYAELRGPVPPRKLSEMTRLGETLFREPLQVTDRGLILDGRARWMVACQQGWQALLCEAYSFATDDEALHFLVQRQLARSEPLNPFCRVLLALELEPALTRAARERQRMAGKDKGKLQSTLTEDVGGEVRSQIAKIAGVSTGNVTKVRQILAACHPDVIEAVRRDEISIHRAHGLRNLLGNRQIQVLKDLQSSRDVRDYIRGRLRCQKARTAPPELTVGELARLLNDSSLTLAGVDVHVLTRGKQRIFITPDLLPLLQPQSLHPE